MTAKDDPQLVAETSVLAGWEKILKGWEVVTTPPPLVEEDKFAFFTVSI